jgi:predicted transcriptional regulator
MNIITSSQLEQLKKDFKKTSKSFTTLDGEWMFDIIINSREEELLKSIRGIDKNVAVVFDNVTQMDEDMYTLKVYKEILEILNKHEVYAIQV